MKNAVKTYQPAVTVQEYNLQDGIYAPDSAAATLSIGNDQEHTAEMSAAVHFSEGMDILPLHRIFDLTLLALSVLREGDALIHPATSLGETGPSEEDSQSFRACCAENRKALDCRIKEIKELLEIYY